MAVVHGGRTQMVRAAVLAPVRQHGPARLRGTPGRLTLMMLALLVFGLGLGFTSLLGIRDRAELVDGVATRSGTLVLAVQELYRSLSDADATAASAFLSGGVEPEPLRNRYQTDIAGASAALATLAGGGITDGPGANAVAEITAVLPVYTGLVATARAYNRQGLPVGAAYLREASGLMRGRLLPAVQKLYTDVSGRLGADRDSAGRFPWWAVPLGVAVVAGLVATQLFLTRRTNRVVNVGLLVATVAALGTVIWLGVAAARTAGSLDTSRRHSSQVDLLVQARTTALQARADEALTLVARGGGAASEKDYTAAMQRLVGEDGRGGLLRQAANRSGFTPQTKAALDSAAENARAWLAVHRNLRAFDDQGRYTEAVALAVGTEANTAAAAFGRLDADLAKAIAHHSGQFTQAARQAGRALSGVDLAVGVLTVLLLAGVVVGIQKRVAEYR